MFSELLSQHLHQIATHLGLAPEVREHLPGRNEAKRHGINGMAYAKYYILDDRFWSYYVSGFDGHDLLWGPEATPDGVAFASFALSEFVNVNVSLDLEIIRDETFQPTPLKVISERFQRNAHSR
jgi:hypothetical protein